MLYCERIKNAINGKQLGLGMVAEENRNYRMHCRSDSTAISIPLDLYIADLVSIPDVIWFWGLIRNDSCTIE